MIVCAGAYGSPQLLMLSGIGRPDELVKLRIEPVAELPGVGLNLQDHPLAVYLSDRADTLFDAFNEANLELLEHGRGPLAGAGSEAGAFVRTSDGLDAPDLQLLIMPALWVEEGLVPSHAPGFSIIASHVRAHAQTQYHPVGSCRMGVDEFALVDPKLRVRGVQALRVVDASICRYTTGEHERADDRDRREGG